MKRIDQLTQEELINLTDEQIRELIDLECAFAGVPLLPPHPGEAPDKPTIVRDTTVYEIGGVETTDFVHASKILEAITSTSICDTIGYGDDAYLEVIGPNDYKFPKIVTNKVMSKAQYFIHKDELKAYKERKDAWDDTKKLYDKTQRARESQVACVWEAVREARDKEMQKNNYISTFNRYLALSNGDRGVAYNFLLNAFPDFAIDQPELAKEFFPTPVKEVSAPECVNDAE